MFDTPDLLPCCVGPFFGLLVGIFVASIDLPDRSKKPGSTQDGPRQPNLTLAILIAPIACLISAFVCNAFHDPAPWFKPFDSGIVGTYQMDPNGGYRITFPAHELVFNDDRTFTMNNVPDLSSSRADWDSRSLSYMNASGIWRIDKDPLVFQPEWIVIAEFNLVNGETDNRIIHFHVTGHLPPYELTYVSEEWVFSFVRK